MSSSVFSTSSSVSGGLAKVALTAALEQAVADSNVRAIILTGKGDHFCAGGDLAWMRRAADYSLSENEQDALKLAHMLEAIAHCSAFVLAKVHGPAFGGGCGLVCACDYVVASDQALFAFSEVRLGLVPATISPYAVEKIGAGNARAFFMTGKSFDAGTALRLGLVHEVVKPEPVSYTHLTLPTILRV